MNQKKENVAKLNANYKTVLCENWKKNGTCRYGKNCQFAHGPDDLLFRQNNIRKKFEKCCCPCFCDNCIWCPPCDRWKLPTSI